MGTQTALISMFTLDTNILIYYFAGDKEVAKFFLGNLEKTDALFLPTIAVTEFLSFPTLTEQDKFLFQELLPQLNIMSLDFDIAILSSELRRNYGLKLADSAIAATALFTGTTLVTRNTRDFKKVPSLSLLKI